MKKLFINIMAGLLCFPATVFSNKLLGVKVLDKDYLIVHLRDGEVHYRDNGTGPSAYRGHDFAEGDDSLIVFGAPLDGKIAAQTASWKIFSRDDEQFSKGLAPVAVHRKAKPMNTDHTLTSMNDHWVFLRLPQSMKQGCSYTVKLDKALQSDQSETSVTFDINTAQSEAVHVNIIGYRPSAPVKAADLYLWLGDGGARDYSSFEGKRVWLYNVATGKKTEAGKVSFWKKASEYPAEANKKNMTGSDVWNIDFRESTPGRYRLVVEDVGCSMDFDIKDDVYLQPYTYSVRGYYYMRLGEKPRPDISPVPRQPTFIPGEDPTDFKVYITDLHPWHPEWRKIGGDVWDEPHFKPAEASAFYRHRVEGNPTNDKVRGGHSDAFDWDRHLAHVSNIYDLLLPYLLSDGRLTEDNLSIAESGNHIPDIIDEARNEVDFFLSIRDGEGYSQGVTNPDATHRMMFQAGCTTMAAWANAANCAMLADCFRVMGNDALRDYYKDEAVKAFRYAERQENSQLDDFQHIGDGAMRGRDFMQMAAAYLYNVTADRAWEDIMVRESIVKADDSRIIGFRDGYQLWGTAAYLKCPHERHYSELYGHMKKAVINAARQNHANHISLRPSRRATNDPRWQTSENVQLLMMAHNITESLEEKGLFERAMTLEADWGLGRNPSNTVEMTGLGERHITDCYTTGRNDGVPEVHPGQTPFNGTETWSKGNGGDAQIILAYCYPKWDDSTWPVQESFFNQRYFWVNGEFTPRETMRGKMALLAYLHSLSKTSTKQLMRETNASFFESGQSREIGEQILLYQRVTGGWPKNIDMTVPLDSLGRAVVLSDKQRRYDSTTDNNATSTEMAYLARLFQSTGEERYREAVLKGVEYLLSGQYKNGGWPQFWPENHGYQVHITYNDNAMVNTLTLLRAIAEDEAPYNGMSDKSMKRRLKKAFDRGIDCILRTQIIVDGRPTVWCQQHDRMTLAPAAARAYELPSFCSSESVGIVRLLMSLPHPNKRVKRAVQGAMEWFEQHKITGYRYAKVSGNATLIPDADAQPLWARFYDLEECLPFVCDRDGIPRRHLEEIGHERRNGYSWYGSYAAPLFPLYEAWQNTHKTAPKGLR